MMIIILKVILILFPAPLLYCYVCDDCPNTLSPLRHMAACPDSSHVSCITTLTTFAEFKSKFFLLFIGTITIIINCIIPVPIPITTLENSEQFTSKYSLSSFSSPSSPSQSSREGEGKRAVQEKISQCCEILAKTSGTGQKKCTNQNDSDTKWTIYSQGIF